MAIAWQTVGERSEVRELANSRTIDGIFVRARCFAHQREAAVRYEIRIDGAGQYAAVDARSLEEARRVIPAALDAFATACALRGATRVPASTR